MKHRARQRAFHPHAHARCVSFLVLSLAVISDLNRCCFAQFELYTPLLERRWLELSGHRNQNSRMRADLVMGNTVPPNNSDLVRHAATMPLAVRQSLKAIRATPYCFLPSTIFVEPISV